MSTKAFSLLECLVALAIVAGSMIVLNQAWSGNHVRVRKAQWQNQMAFLLERKMIELELEHSGPDKNLDNVPEELKGDFNDLGKEFSDFSWQFKSQKLDMPSMLPTLPEELREQEMFQRVISQMTDHINQSVREVQLSVQLDRGGRSVAHSVTTYFVDFKRNITPSAQ